VLRNLEESELHMYKIYIKLHVKNMYFKIIDNSIPIIRCELICLWF